MATSKVVEFLNEVLEAERAGASALRKLSTLAGDPAVRQMLTAVGSDSAWCCAILIGHIRRLGGLPSGNIGRIFEEILAPQSLVDRLRTLNQGHNWVVRQLEEKIPQIADQALADDLATMVCVHKKNLDHCDQQLSGLGKSSI